MTKDGFARRHQARAGSGPRLADKLVNPGPRTRTRDGLTVDLQEYATTIWVPQPPDSGVTPEPISVGGLSSKSSVPQTWREQRRGVR